MDRQWLPVWYWQICTKKNRDIEKKKKNHNMASIAFHNKGHTTDFHTKKQLYLYNGHSWIIVYTVSHSIKKLDLFGKACNATQMPKSYIIFVKLRNLEYLDISSVLLRTIGKLSFCYNEKGVMDFIITTIKEQGSTR